MSITMTLQSPLFTTWMPQYVRLWVKGLSVGQGARLMVDGAKTDFQYTGRQDDRGAEVMLILGFDGVGQTRKLEFVEAPKSTTDLTAVEIPLEKSASIGYPGRKVRIPGNSRKGQKQGQDAHATGSQKGLDVAGPLGGMGSFPLTSSVHCQYPLQERTLRRVGQGPLYIEYVLEYRFAENRSYTLTLRCYKHEPIVEVAEKFLLGMNAELVMTLNPRKALDQMLARRGSDITGESQPESEAVALERPRDILCRIQMPVMCEYYIPNNLGWFALYDSGHEDRGMLGVQGLYGQKWQEPVANMIHVFVTGGRCESHAALCSGERFWLLYAGPLEKGWTEQRRLCFHRYHSEFNRLRLDEHLDLTGQGVWDASCWDTPGYFGPDYRRRAKENAQGLLPLKKALAENCGTGLQVIVQEKDEGRKAMLDDMLGRMALWIRQNQGYRRGDEDYDKCGIGHSRRLRSLMVCYELLRKEGYLTAEQVGKINSYLVASARWIMDEGFWPTSRCHLHADNPDSTKDFYNYPGEHRADKVTWANNLPNFQSDPMAALLQIAALIPEHPDAKTWQRKAIDDIESQLNAFAGRSGAWEESINYALYTFYYYTLTFRVAKNRLGIDYFQDSRMRAFAGWLTRYMGPYDKRFKAYVFPGIGNSVLPQNQGHYLLAYAAELSEGDSLRDDLIACYQKMEPDITLPWTRPVDDMQMYMAATCFVPAKQMPLRPLGSEHMDEIGVALRDGHPSASESYLFQKIGWAKDHYEGDETSFNWYAKGTPLTMDYGTYSGDTGTYSDHNLVQVPDNDPLRRGFLAAAHFSPVVDYTRCEVPIVQKLSWGHQRTWAEVDDRSIKPTFFYIGEPQPVGPKTWSRRMLMFVKPDYLVIFDRILGATGHRYNLHAVVEDIRRDGAVIHGRGRYDLDLLCYVQHPTQFEMQTGELVPAPDRYGKGESNPHRQKFFRVYNIQDNVYRTVLFAKERERGVMIESFGASGVKVVTPQYTDYAFAADQVVRQSAEGVSFQGRVGWIRKTAAGEVQAALIDGDAIGAFGRQFAGPGPWTYNMDGKGSVELLAGPPRTIKENG